jgi:serine phosphatase RsbU (regulator of sigma subunit)
MARPRVLLVDDDPGMLHALQRVLERNCELRGTTDARQALALADAFAPELAFVDVRMPGIDGFELLARLKARYPDIDVIIVTGSVSELDAKLARAIRENAFFFLQKPFDRDVLLTLVERWQERRELALANRGYLQRLEAELAAARAFQRSMFPGEGGEVNGVTLAGRCEPCDALGGDIYDWVDAGSGRVTVLVADVSGHGVPAAMLTGFVKSALHSAHVDGYAPRSVALRVRNGLRTMDEGAFITLLCARFDAEAGHLEYVNAGHPAGVFGSPGAELADLPPSGPLLSPAFSDADWRVVRLPLAPGGHLLLHTDGVEEAQRPDGELFGRDRLLELVRGGATGGALVDAILREVARFTEARPARDDYTLLSAAVAR